MNQDLPHSLVVPAVKSGNIVSSEQQDFGGVPVSPTTERQISVV
jgi:hypothetical protein